MLNACCLHDYCHDTNKYEEILEILHQMFLKSAFKNKKLTDCISIHFVKVDPGVLGIVQKWTIPRQEGKQRAGISRIALLCSILCVLLEPWASSSDAVLCGVLYLWMRCSACLHSEGLALTLLLGD